ncbi:MAG: hypothetical protein KKA07_15000, partial [Bacteroidetes bacterium]|nr:hypothetical protein [Bacteroidota bacterium]
QLAKKIGKTNYSKVTIKGTIIVENLQPKTISLEIKKNLVAEVTNASESGKITRTGRYNVLNPVSLISWEIPLSPNQKKEMTYQYEVYIAAY